MASLRAVIACAGRAPIEIYRALLVANAANLLSFEIAQQDKVKVPVSGNVNWLDFTHGLTFANAVRRQCERFPEQDDATSHQLLNYTIINLQRICSRVLTHVVTQDLFFILRQRIELLDNL